MTSNRSRQAFRCAHVVTASLGVLLLSVPAFAKARECSRVNLGNGKSQTEYRDIDGKCKDGEKARRQFNEMFEGVVEVGCIDLSVFNPGPNSGPLDPGAPDPLEIVNTGSILDFSTILSQPDGVIVVVPPHISAHHPDFALAVRNNMTAADFESITSADLISFLSTSFDVWAVENAQVIEDQNTFAGHTPFQGERMLCMSQTGGSVSDVRQDIDLTPYLTEVAQGRVSVRAVGWVASSDVGATITMQTIPRIGIQGAIASSGATQSQIVLNGPGWTQLALPGEIPIPADATTLELRISASNSTIPNGACLDSVFHHLLIDGEVQVAGLTPTTLPKVANEVSTVANEEFANIVLSSVPPYTTGPGSDFTIAYHTFRRAGDTYDTALTGTEFVDFSTASLSFTGLDDSVSCNPGHIPVLRSDLSVVCVQPPPVPVMSLSGRALLSVLVLYLATHRRALGRLRSRPIGEDTSP